MNTQTFAQTQDFTAITDEELMTVNGGFLWGPAGGVLGGMYAGVAANAIGVELPAMAGPAGVGAMITNHH